MPFQPLAARVARRASRPTRRASAALAARPAPPRRADQRRPARPARAPLRAAPRAGPSSAELKRAGFSTELIKANVGRSRGSSRGSTGSPGDGVDRLPRGRHLRRRRPRAKEAFVREAGGARDGRALAWDLGCNDGAIRGSPPRRRPTSWRSTPTHADRRAPLPRGCARRARERHPAARASTSSTRRPASAGAGASARGSRTAAARPRAMPRARPPPRDQRQRARSPRSSTGSPASAATLVVEFPDPRGPDGRSACSPPKRDGAHPDYELDRPRAPRGSGVRDPTARGSAVWHQGAPRGVAARRMSDGGVAAGGTPNAGLARRRGIGGFVRWSQPGSNR